MTLTYRGQKYVSTTLPLSASMRPTSSIAVKLTSK